MEICGLQKTTLIDYPGKVACTIFLYGCNFKCGFCYNPELVIEPPKSKYTEEEILSFLKKQKNKLDAICITGGEPLLTLEKSFLKKIKALGYLIKIDTNGTNPEKLSEFIEEKLIDFIAMDIKTNKENYSNVTAAEVDIKKIEKSIKIISVFPNYEFRTTIVKDLHTPETISSIGQWLNTLTASKPKKYYLQGFKNQGDFIDKNFLQQKNTAEKYLKELKAVAEKYFNEVGIRV